MRKVQTEPNLSIFMQPLEQSLSFIDLVIQNIGLGPAYNLIFKIDPDFEYERGKLLSGRGFLKKGIGYLAPSQKIVCFLTSLFENRKSKLENSFKIRVKYENAMGIMYDDIFEIDFSELIGLERIGTPPIHKIADNIEKINNNIDRISSGFNRVKVIAYTKEDIEEEYAKHVAERIEMMENQKNPK